jgi:hypothetical protein
VRKVEEISSNFSKNEDSSHGAWRSCARARIDIHLDRLKGLEISRGRSAS